MYVTDRPVIDRLTDPLLRAVEDMQELVSELDMAIEDPDYSEHTPRTVCDVLELTLTELESAAGAAS